MTFAVKYIHKENILHRGTAYHRDVINSSFDVTMKLMILKDVFAYILCSVLGFKMSI